MLRGWGHENDSNHLLLCLTLQVTGEGGILLNVLDRVFDPT